MAKRFTLGFILSTSFAGAAAAQPSDFTFHKIIEQHDPIPDDPSGQTYVKEFSGAVTSGAGRVVFEVKNQHDKRILFQKDSHGFVPIAHSGDPLPGNPGDTYQGATWGTVDSGRTSFTGSGLQGLLYGWSGGPISLMVDRDTPIPGQTGKKFTNLIQTQPVGNGVAFMSDFGTSQNSQYGLYRWTPAGVQRLADATMPVPGGTGNFREFYSYTGSDAAALLIGTDATNRTAIFSSDGSTLSVVLDRNSQAPGDLGKFKGFGGLASSATDLVFAASVEKGAAFNGVFRKSGNSITQLLAAGESRPDGGGDFSDLDNISFGQSTLVVGVGAGDAVYAKRDGVIKRIVGVGDTVDGKMVSSAYVAATDISDGRVLVYLTRAGPLGSLSSLYVVDIPAPGAMAMLGIAVALTPRRRR